MAAQQRFELFGFWRSSATYRIRVALKLKGLAATERFVNLDAGEQRSEAFLKLNPQGGLPVLIDHGADKPAALTQSLAILEYIDETHPSPPLLPADPGDRARVRSLAAMLAADTHPLVVPRVKKYLTSEGKFDDAAWRAWQIRWLTAGLQALEHRLKADKETAAFCHGDSVTIADICLASIVVITRVFKIDVAGIPTVNRIMASCERNEAFAKADPRLQEGAPAA
jgi:maleylacetoacetate isomerase